jgi:ATP-binding cassette, subfamily C (CFTR/MRP), member 1
VSLATFTVYVLSGHKLDVASALTALALFELLRFPLFMLPQIIGSTVEAIVSLNRLQSFLLCKEHEPVGPQDLHENGITLRQLSAVYDSNRSAVDNAIPPELAEVRWDMTLLRAQLDDAEHQIQALNQNTPLLVPRSSSWSSITPDGQNSIGEMVVDPTTKVTTIEGADDQSYLLCLKRIDFDCRPGELIVVVGGVGCGKSSFMNIILGEARRLSGTIAVRGQLAYFSQTPFILNATIRDNIIFSHLDDHVDEDRYQRVLDCCALRHDLALFSDGDMTEIGEKGVTLSGGQKARVALARAAYHDADISLIDDALAAVDAHLARQLFDEVLVRELMSGREGRSVILSTNAVHLLHHPRVDRIVVLHDGRIVEQGSYEQLANRADSAFARFVAAASDKSSADNSDLDSESDSDEHSTERQNRTSFASHESDALGIEKAKLMSEETKKVGSVELGTYLAWARAAGGMYVPIFVLLGSTFYEGTFTPPKKPKVSQGRFNCSFT